jgi:hypothetical protein
MMYEKCLKQSSKEGGSAGPHGNYYRQSGE